MNTDHYRVKPTEMNETRTAKKNSSIRDGIHQHFKNYCSTTSIHGFTYFGEHRTWFEYLWWFVVFTLSVSTAVYMIYGIYMKWLQTPVLVSFATKNRAVYDVPFPAVTICPVTQLRRRYFNLTQYLKGDFNDSNKEEMNKKNSLSNYMDLLCDDYQTENPSDFLDANHFFTVLHKENTWNFIKDKSQMKFNRETLDISDMFKETYTQQGLCYTFNRMSLNDIYTDIVVRNEQDPEDFTSTWSPSTGYSKNVSNAVYPRRGTRAGLRNGLFIKLLEPEENNDVHCEQLSRGYRITIHYPSRIPATKEDFLVMPADDVVAIPIQPSMILTSETVKNYEPDKRDCYFPPERKLKYFRTYTMRNCQLECLTNVTLKMCDCVEFYMPRENGTKICGPGKRNCVENAAKKIRDDTLKKNIDQEYGIVSRDDDDYDDDDDGDGEGDNDYNDDDDDSCDCLAMCTDITYNAYIEPYNVKSKQIKELRQYLEEESILGNKSFFPNCQVSIAVLYFKEDKISTTERNELYGPTDFISNFGGLLGLFTGFSILSLMEIIYFLTLRIAGNIRLFGRWAGPNE